MSGYIDYHILADEAGDLTAPEGVEIVAVREEEGARWIDVRLTGLEDGRRGMVACLNDQRMYYASSHAQVCAFPFPRDASELWLSAAFWPEEAEQIVPLPPAQ